MRDGHNAFTVFIVDDDDAVRDSLKALLEFQDYRVRDYPSGAAFLAAEQPPHKGCLVLDLHMPVMSGFELLDILTASRFDLPVILITGRNDAAVRARADGSGAVALLEKPFDDDVLLQTIRRALAVPANDAAG
ncbi:MAG: response regulator [Proteobacteria bacterium]|nr:response regulator [Pseudomonadota bacterium]